MYKSLILLLAIVSISCQAIPSQLRKWEQKILFCIDLYKKYATLQERTISRKKICFNYEVFSEINTTVQEEKKSNLHLQIKQTYTNENNKKCVSWLNMQLVCLKQILSLWV